MQNQYKKLMNEAYNLPNGESKVALYEEAMRIADLHRVLEDRFETRMNLTDAAVMSGQAEKAIVAFAWCLQQFDQGIQVSSPYLMLWHYKWICDRIDNFPEISVAKIDETLVDYKKRLLSHGYGLRSYHKLRKNHEWQKGDIESTKYYYNLWLSTPRDQMTDCHACELNNQASTLLFLGRLDQALHIAKPLFNGGISCNTVPQVSYSPFLLTLLEHKQYKKAAKFYQKSYELNKKQSNSLGVVTDWIEYLTVVDRTKAIMHTEKYISKALGSFVPSIKYRFYLAVTTLWDHLNERERKVVHLPTEMKMNSLHAELLDTAERFDQRNGNDHFVNGIAKRKQRITHCLELYTQWQNEGKSQ